MENSRQNTALVLLKEQGSEARFNRASEILKEKIRLKIISMDIYSIFYINEFLQIGKYQKVRQAFDELVKEGLLVKVKAYPVFYERSILAKKREELNRQRREAMK